MNGKTIYWVMMTPNNSNSRNIEELDEDEVYFQLSNLTKCSDIYISTKTKFVFRNKPVNDLDLKTYFGK